MPDSAQQHSVVAAVDPHTLDDPHRRSSIVIRPVVHRDLDDIIILHEKTFEGFFMTQLGPRFLRQYYASVLDCPNSIFYTAEQNHRLSGFVAGFVDPATFYCLLRRRRLHLAFAILPRLLVNRRLPLRVLATMRLAGRRSENAAPMRTAELASIGVLKDDRQRGVGERLVQVFCRDAFSRDAQAVTLTTDTDRNEGVNRFYLRLGFREAGCTLEHGNRLMTRYTLSRADHVTVQ